ncbi:hypothetical protein FRX31_022820 [Thalictrum thalictroides]|uniref:Uncharacterized protein n=1 Tax=Thalictrum thalictroides TaxID=46969 RepID=A0A7J6VT95_THATH|nr:hypothetical protein FRX31_022820 [Thalictrum thalictroides]
MKDKEAEQHSEKTSNIVSSIASAFSKDMGMMEAQFSQCKERTYKGSSLREEAHSQRKKVERSMQQYYNSRIKNLFNTRCPKHELHVLEDNNQLVDDSILLGILAGGSENELVHYEGLTDSLKADRSHASKEK